MKNIPILWKLMLVVAVMAAITAIVSGIAYSNIGKLSAAAENIDHASQRALLTPSSSTAPNTESVPIRRRKR